MTQFAFLSPKSQMSYLPDKYIMSKKFTNSSGYFISIIYWKQQILSAKNCFVATFERDKCPFIKTVSYPYQWTIDTRIQDFLIITISNKGGGDKAFLAPHFAPRVWAKPTEGIFQLIDTPRTLFMGFHGLQTVI